MEYTQQIEALKKRRSQSGKKKNWTHGLSPEAQVAMRLALEDTKAMKLERENTLRLQNEQKQNEQGKSINKVAFVSDQSDHGHDSADSNVKSPNVLSREPSYTELFERSGSARMRRDMTDESYSEESDPKRALGGGKVESTMELVEIVNHDKPDESTTLDEHAIEELRRINSVDKCTVWIEATEVHQRETLADIPEVDSETR